MDNRDLRMQLRRFTDDLGEPGRDELTGFGLVNLGKMDRIRLVRTRHWLAGWRVYDVGVGRHIVSIRNQSLYGVISWVTQSGVFRRDLSAVHIFGTALDGMPQQVELALDAGDSGLRLMFIPFGKVGAFADITITKEE